MPSSGAVGEVAVAAATVKAATARRSRMEVGTDGAMVAVVVVSGRTT
jgi:hypothetical protein